MAECQDPGGDRAAAAASPPPAQTQSKVLPEDVGDVPLELTYTPVPYIGLVGLNAAANELHHSIWTNFTQNRSIERPALYFKLHPDSKTIFPQMKPKKASYEWYIPKGILKTNWMSKHLFAIPSVAVLFLDMDWSDTSWQDKRLEIISKVEFLRRTLSGRATRVVLVLIQIQSADSRALDDPLVVERMATLCAQCDLGNKSLFVLPTTTDPKVLFAYILKMESAFNELAKVYYAQEVKTLRVHRDQLTKSTHALLFVRHQFKMGFFSEFRVDSHGALAAYKKGYNQLMEIRPTPINSYELKTIAGFLNYKICRLAFFLNQPLEAIHQFRGHIDIWRSRTAPLDPVELEFEHAAWLCKQYSQFAELFDQAISLGLMPAQHQHPGYYFHEGSCQALQRRTLAKKHCANISLDPAAAASYKKFFLDLPQTMEFFGQRPWRPGLQAIDPTDWDLEKQGIRALQYREATQINYSKQIIKLLGSAADHFKQNRCPRMKRYMMVLIGREYLVYGKNYTAALTAFTQVLPAYRSEGWSTLVIQIYLSAIYSAYLGGKPDDFLCLTQEFLQTYSDSIEVSIRLVLERCVDQILSGKCPETIPTLPPECVVKALQTWSSLLDHKEWTPPTREELLNRINPSVAQSQSKSIFEELAQVNITVSGQGGSDQLLGQAPPSQINLDSSNSIIFVSTDIPTKTTSRTPLVVSYTITSKLDSQSGAASGGQPLPLEVSMGTSDSFMFSGNKSLRLGLAPGASTTLRYVLYPLMVGKLPLPPLEVIAYPGTPQALTFHEQLDKWLPGEILVLPPPKNS